MAYSFQQKDSGLYEVYNDGQRVATGTSDILKNYGLSAGPSPVSETLSGMQARVSNQGKAGYDVFGNPVSDLVADNGTSRDDEATLAASLRDSALRTAPDLSYIDNYIAGLTARQQAAEKNINEQFDATKASLGEQQRKETGSTSAGIARAGGYLGFSGSSQGVLINLAETHRAEMSGLEAKRQAALQEARNAYEEKQFAAAQQRYKEAKEYENESYQRQQDYFAKVKAATDKAKKDEEDELAYAQILDAYQSGSTSEFDIYKALEGKVSPDQINTFFTKLKPKTAPGDRFKLSNTQLGQLLGAGMGQADIQALSDYVNEKGYTDELKATLTPYQRRVMDSIYTLKPAGGTGGLKADFIPTTLSQFVAQNGISAVYEGLLKGDVPVWFYPILEQIGAQLDGPRTLDPGSEDAVAIWNEFRKQPDVQTFVGQLNRKVLGNVDALSDVGDFGAFGTAPEPVSEEDEQ